MAREKGSTLTSILTARRENLHLAAIAIIAATGIGIFASSLTVIFERDVFLLAGVSGLVILLSTAYLLFDISRRLFFSEEIGAVIAFNSTDGSVIELPRYRFSDEFLRTLRAVEAENRAIHSEWTKYPICESRKVPSKIGDSSVGAKETEEKDSAKSEKTAWSAVTRVDSSSPEFVMKPRSVRLLEEIAEFIVIEQLSTHLSTYFNDYDDDSFVLDMERGDIPDFLLKNRVLNLLSTPIEQRDIFLDAFPNPDERPKGEIYSLYGSNGAMYSRFDLRLPAGSRIHKSGDAGFTISTSRFTLDIRVQYTGYHKNIPYGFAELYLDIPYRDVSTRSISIMVRGRVNPLSLLWSRGWKYHTWLDSFRDELYERFSFEEYFNQLNWSIVEPIFKVGIPLSKKLRQS